MNDRLPYHRDDGDAGDEPDPRALVTIRRVRSEFEANLIVSLLQDADIEAFAFVLTRNALPISLRQLDIPVQVRAGDRVAAEAVLAERRDAGDSTDWDSVDLGEREDDLPLRQPGRMPLAARLAFFIAACIAVLAALATAVAILLGSGP